MRYVTLEGSSKAFAFLAGEIAGTKVRDAGRSESVIERVERAAERLRELKASGVNLAEILGGEAGAAFVRDDCDGDSKVAYAAFALVHSPKSQSER